MKSKFFYRDIVVEVPDSVYFPRDDSIMLAELLEREKPETALDLGCGSGFLAILLAKRGCKVTAADVNPKAVEAAEKNAAMNFVDIKIIESDLFQNIKYDFDLIVFNPPYLPFEPYDLQWSGGIDLIKKFLEDAKSRLKKDGKIIFVVSNLTAPEKEIIEVIEKNGYKYKIFARRKIPWEELIAFELKL